MKYEIISAEQTEKWKNAIKKTGNYDFYHLPEYHKLHATEGNPILFVYKEDSNIIALPLIVRKIDSIQGLEAFSQYFDVTSVYGYPGPVSNCNLLQDSGFLKRFWKLFYEIAKSSGWVTLFSRLHPILENHRLIQDSGDIVPVGETVSIDLSESSKEQWKHYSTNHKRNIKKLINEGAEVLKENSEANLDAFIELYYQTMERVGATSYYFFPKRYFQDLLDMTLDGEPIFHLFLCKMDGMIVSGGLFSYCNRFVQYHLGATHGQYLKKAPIKLVFDRVRLWALENTEAKFFHLGGGVGCQNDSLFRFKAGFSPLRHRFHIWKWVILPDLYRNLIEAKEKWLQKKELKIPEGNYFPEYRID